MNATNRVVNRLFLLLAGLAALAAGAVALLVGVELDWVERIKDTLKGWAQQLWTLINDVTPEWLSLTFGDYEVQAPIILAGALLLILLVSLITFVCTRGGGKTSTVLTETVKQGTTAVDQSVADAVLADAMSARTEVISASTSVYRVKRQPTIKLTVTVRQGAHLPPVLEAANAAVAEWDRLAGSEVPVIVHLAGRGGFDRFRGTSRVQ